MQGIAGVYLLYFDIILYHLQTEVKYRQLNAPYLNNGLKASRELCLFS